MLEDNVNQIVLQDLSLTAWDVDLEQIAARIYEDHDYETPDGIIDQLWVEREVKGNLGWSDPLLEIILRES